MLMERKKRKERKGRKNEKNVILEFYLGALPYLPWWLIFKPGYK
jgi:hypothetical protein